MLLPDNIQPEQTIYFNGAYVLKALQEHNNKVLLDLFVETQRYQPMTMPVFVLCLDWLFLLDVILLNKQGRIELCS